MKQVIYISAVAFVLLLLRSSEALSWEYSGFAGFDYNETIVSDNWEGSEQDSKNWMISLDLSAEREREYDNWLNTLKSEYGEASVSGGSSQVSADLIDIESVYTRKLNVYLNPYGAASVISQFNEFFNPSVLGQSAGLGWSLIKQPDQTLNTRIGAALRQRLEKGEEPLHQTGAESVTSYSLKMREGTRFVSELRLFTEFEEEFEMRWDNSLYVKLRQYLTARAGYLVLYGPSGKYFIDNARTRFTLGLGFSFNLV